MIYGSVCSGIEAATVAWEPLGWKPSFFSEIEKFPRAVLEHHYPDTPLHGDFTTIKENEYEPIDLLVGGTPCQSFSVAGLRKGMDDERGNLALEYLKLAKRLGPRWLVWENVPGVLPSNGGRDFGSFLGALVELGYGWSYRVLDAQYFGVPQRRRRVFVVAYLGDWRPAAAVLFERESLSRNTPPSRKKGKEFAGDVGEGSFSTSGAGYWRDGIGPLRGREQDSHENVVACLDANYGRLQGCSGQDLNHGHSHLVVHGTQDPCISSKAFALGLNNGQENVLAVRTANTSANGHGLADNVAHTLDGANGQAVAAFSAGQSKDAGSIAYQPEQSPALREGASGTNQVPSLHDGIQVRRLTPVECERLQDFPDNYTFIPRYAKPRKADLEEMARYCGFESVEEYIAYGPPGDGPRYKALGNSFAIPPVRWLGKRIDSVNKSIKGDKIV